MNYFCCQSNYGVIYCGCMTNPTITIDKRQTAQYIRTLMDRAGLDWDELQNALKTPPAPANAIPEAWKNARGILKHKRIDPLAYQNTIRDEWDH